ncbi:hypothetical protein [Clostridium butyricum]|uniref:Uncharacterized protein n=1 Tax=Clostridium butyricum E4 str. BoNT E BL5262 TaxID=632245 RepID=C4IGS8_CLOBU|nr:hypothetical protein [Clostridium butyricum]EDT74765.1 hypothetical protein CBY_2559 [Clostridium butyricum 5521]EEP54943.1 conserved hypothetical protein [Clostridium butyricum E4 str. BoNT E BL5262]NFL30496.1 hypothetical protein [Clostridium butyricum]NFS19451.1 hypothetical protein [Clostridium butyricum]
MENINVDEIIERAIQKYDNKQKRKYREKAFRNTKLLMDNYRDFKNHIEYSISDVNELQGIVELDLKKNDCDELFILSIKQSKVKTLIMTSHIEAALLILEEEQERTGTHERYDALVKYYLENKSYEKIAEELNAGKNTPSRWVREMIDRLSVLLFGIDGLKME